MKHVSVRRMATYGMKGLRVPDGQETRTVSETGGAKGSKLARFDLIPWDVLTDIAEHYGRGAFKYEDRNWERGYDWGLSLAALHRHLAAHWNGDVYDTDPYLYGVESDGTPTYTREEIEAFPADEKALHITAVAWHALALSAFYKRGIGNDNRPNTRPSSSPS